MPVVASLVTLAQVKDQLRITHAFADAELQRHLDDAEDIIRRYLKTLPDPAWTADTVPGAVRAAILRQATHLATDRGDRAGEATPDGLAPFVADLLTLYRDPALA
jgi:Phage gp6-like head-tail connector protein